jgi:hypothetical protein
LYRFDDLAQESRTSLLVGRLEVNTVSDMPQVSDNTLPSTLDSTIKAIHKLVEATTLFF